LEMASPRRLPTRRSSMSERCTMKHVVEKFITTTNASDIDGALSLFAPTAVIVDVSVGGEFVGREGVRAYLDRFFVGYKTLSRLLSIENIDDQTAVARIDFTGDFGHEVGSLKMAINLDGLIQRINADLE
jgi:ketosteroid isomerase-like protein